MSQAINVNPAGLYESALGEKNRDYYVEKFQKFDQKGPGLKVSWNWPAFFFGGIWALYRKMYGWFFGWWFVVTVLTVFKTIPNAEIQLTLAAVALTCWLGFAVFANSLYQSKIKARIANANKANSDASLADSRLRAESGIHYWVPIVFGALPVIGIVAATAIPAYMGKNEGRVASTQQAATLEKPAQALAKPELQATTQPKVIGPDAANQRLVSEADKKAQAELEQAQLMKAWESEVDAVVKTAKTEGMDYRAKGNEALLDEFNGLVRAFGDEASQRGMTDDGLKASKWALKQAHNAMMKRHGKPSAITTKKKAVALEHTTQDLIDAGIRYKPVAPLVQAVPPQTQAPVKTVADAKKLYPTLGELDDDQVVDAIHGAFYQDLPRSEIAKALGVTLKPVFVPKALGPIDRWRYQSCQKDAAQAPTQQGVNAGLRICREKFAQ